MIEGWSGRIDVADGDRGHRWHQVVREYTHHGEPGICFLGLASDEGVRRNSGRAGAAEGPLHLRRAMSSLALHHNMEMRDAGDVGCTDGNLEFSQMDYASRAAEAIEQGHIVIGLGGGHEIAWASFMGLTKVHTSGKIGVLNLDAHFDLRESDTVNSGTSFLSILELSERCNFETEYRCYGISEPNNTRALFERADVFDVHYVRDTEIDHQTMNHLVSELGGWLRTLDHLHLSICLDVLPASVAPGVSAPAGRGVPIEFIERLVSVAVQSGKLRIADLAELCPRLDIDSRTARSAARLVYSIVQGVASCRSTS